MGSAAVAGDDYPADNVGKHDRTPGCIDYGLGEAPGALIPRAWATDGEDQQKNTNSMAIAAHTPPAKRFGGYAPMERPELLSFPQLFMATGSPVQPVRTGIH
jgi:hypothetical protein